MKIHVFDTDPRKISEPDVYRTNMGSFGIVADQFNRGLKEIGCYAEPDDADYVGVCDGLNFGFKYKNKKPFLIHVWDQINTLPVELLALQQMYRIKMVGLSNQVSNLWRKYGVECETAMPGCDTSFFFSKDPRPEPDEKFIFLFESFANVRSGLDLAVQAFHLAFGESNKVELIIKNTSNSKVLENKIQQFNKGNNIRIINKRVSFEFMRDLYSVSDVTLHVYRHSSWGLGIHQAAACGSTVLLGDFCPSNEMGVGWLIKPSGEIKIREKLPELVNEWGLHNAYGNFSYQEDPMFYEYSIEEYANKMIDLRKNFNIYKTAEKLNYEYLSRDFSLKKAAEDLAKALS